MSWEDTLSALARQTGSRDFSSGLADAGGARDFSGGAADDEEQQIGGTDDSSYAHPVTTKAGQAAKVRVMRMYAPTMQNQGNSVGWGNLLGSGLASVLGHYFGKD